MEIVAAELDAMLTASDSSRCDLYFVIPYRRGIRPGVRHGLML